MWNTLQLNVKNINAGSNPSLDFVCFQFFLNKFARIFFYYSSRIRKHLLLEFGRNLFFIFHLLPLKTTYCETSETVVSMTDYNIFNLTDSKIRRLQQWMTISDFLCILCVHEFFVIAFRACRAMICSQQIESEQVKRYRR